MWQILNTSSQSSPSHPSSTPNTTTTGTSTQLRTWKYGRVMISDDNQNLSMQSLSNGILLTTQPFDHQMLSNSQIKDRIVAIQSEQENKCLQTVDQVCQKFMQKGVNKESTIYIQGGGLLLDLGGFACSIYMRGVKKVVFMPTTLLAIVDATVGGKNGVNWGGAKNMLGTINHAHQIRISLNFLDSLNDREFANGLAEVIKMAITHDEKLFQLLEDEAVTPHRLRIDKELLRKIIKNSLDIKIKVVENDQFDKNQRKWLNFGHTIGHALQMSAAGQKLKHGECVAIGIMQELKIGEQLKYVKDKNLVQRVEKVLKKFNLPTKMPEDINSKVLIELMTKDKKNQTSNKVQFALVETVGLRLQKTASIPIQKLEQNYCQSVRIAVKEPQQVTLKNEIEKANLKWSKQKRFPSSKSLSIRYLFLSALSFKKNRQKVVINNFLQSQDTFFMIQCLKALGFGIQFDPEKRQLQINNYKQMKSGRLNVGNSGLTARFILPLCAYFAGQWTIQCHTRMSQRPNQEIFNFCKKHFDCEFQWVSQRQNCFPTTIKTKGLVKNTLKDPIELNSQESSQFISSVLLNSYLWNGKRVELRVPSGKLVSETYILMTIDCLNNFGASIMMTTESKNYSSIVVSFIPIFIVSEVNIQQDLSSYSYPYGLSLIHSVKAPNPVQSVQGDKKFYQYCQSLLSNNLAQKLDFSECTDTFMTMAAILATNTENRFGISHKSLQISGISNQRVKQSNRIKLTKDNLSKIGYNIEETADGLIFPIGDLKYKDFNQGETIVFETAGDHRLAMSMGILSTYLSLNEKIRFKNVKFVIDDKNAVKKTFPEFWNYLSDSGISLHYDTPTQTNSIKSTPKLKSTSQSKLSRTILMGNRGSGKSAIARMLCSNKKSTKLIDIDEEITKTINQEYEPYKSIAELVENKGWQQFRKLQYRQIQKYAYSNYLQNSQNRDKNIIISLGGGVVDYQNTINALAGKSKEKQIRKIYIQKKLQDLQIVLNDKRPFIPNFAQVFQSRSQKYEQICDHIITIPSMGQPNQYTYTKVNDYVLSQYHRIFKQPNNSRYLEQGFIYCMPSVYGENGEIIDWVNDEEIKQMNVQKDSQNNQPAQDRVTGVQLRVDSLINQILNKDSSQYSQSQLGRKLRHSIASYKIANHSLIKYLPTILTLRTHEQYGLYPDDPAGYQKWVKFLQKIPTSYIDYQIKYLTEPKIDSSHTNYIYTYHGQSIKMINRLLEMHGKIKQEQTKDLVKVCYNGPDHIWNRYHGRWSQSSDICVNLKNPLTRLDNKFKMVIRENDKSKIIRIPTRKELNLISRVSKYFL